MAFLNLQKFSGFMTGTNRAEAFLSGEATSKKRLRLDDIPPLLQLIDNRWAEKDAALANRSVKASARASKTINAASGCVTAYAFNMLVEKELKYCHYYQVEDGII